MDRTPMTPAELEAALAGQRTPTAETDLLVAKALGEAPMAAEVLKKDDEGLGVEWQTPGFAAAMESAMHEPDRESRKRARAAVWDSGEAHGIAWPYARTATWARRLLPDHGTPADDWIVTTVQYPASLGGRVQVEVRRAAAEAGYTGTSGPDDPEGGLALLRAAVAARRGEGCPSVERT